MPTTAAYTLVPSSLNSESYDVVSHDGTILGAITRDVCNGRTLYGAWSETEGAGFVGRYGSLEEAAEAIAATWPTVEQPTEGTPAPAEDATPGRRFHRIRTAIGRLFHHTERDTFMPKPNNAPQQRPARCADCGDRIDIDPDGWRTLCACDATE